MCFLKCLNDKMAMFVSSIWSLPLLKQYGYICRYMDTYSPESSLTIYFDWLHFHNNIRSEATIWEWWEAEMLGI